MSSVTPVSGSTNTIVAPSTTASAQSTLSTQDFLQLLATQMQNQDPLQPMDNSAYLAQMAQFTSLQQMNTLSSTVSVMSSSQQQLAAVSYLGRNVTMDNGNSGTAVGTVTAVDTSGSTPQLQVNGTYYPLTSLLSVAPASPSTTPTTTPTTN